MGKHGTFGFAGGAAGVEDAAEVFWRGNTGWIIPNAPGVIIWIIVEEGREKGRRKGSGNIDGSGGEQELLKGGKCGSYFFDEGEVCGVGNEEGCFGIGQDMMEFGGGKFGVDWDDSAGNTGDGKVGFDPVGTVWKQERYMCFTRDEPMCAKPFGEDTDAIECFGIGTVLPGSIGEPTGEDVITRNSLDGSFEKCA